MKMYSFKVDEEGKEILVKSIEAQLKILQTQILRGDESIETINLYEKVSQLLRGILYTKTLKKEGTGPSQELPNWLLRWTFSLNKLLTDGLNGTRSSVNNEEVIASGLSVSSGATNELVNIVTVISTEFTSSLKRL